MVQKTGGVHPITQADPLRHALLGRSRAGVLFSFRGQATHTSAVSLARTLTRLPCTLGKLFWYRGRRTRRKLVARCYASLWKTRLSSSVPLAWMLRIGRMRWTGSVSARKAKASISLPLLRIPVSRLRKLLPLLNLGTAMAPMKLRSCMRKANYCLVAQRVNRFVDWTHNVGQRGRHSLMLDAPQRLIHG